jgi:hypothetical protein
MCSQILKRTGSQNKNISLSYSQSQQHQINTAVMQQRPEPKHFASNYEEKSVEEPIAPTVHEQIAAKRYMTQGIQGKSSVSTAAVSSQIASLSMLPGLKLSASIPRPDPSASLVKQSSKYGIQLDK